MLSKFEQDRDHLKIKLRKRKRRLSQKITQKRQDYGYKCQKCHMSKNGTCYEKKVFFKMYIKS